MRKIKYTLSAKLFFNLDENIDIDDYLDPLRGIGEAEVINVEVVEVDKYDTEVPECQK